jgi:hypothetical protein
MTTDRLQKLKASVDAWSQTLPDSEETQPETAAQMDATVAALGEIENNPELSSDPFVSEVKGRIAHSSKKKFVGSWLMVVVVTLVWLLILKTHFHAMGVRISPEEAGARAAQAVHYGKTQIEEFGTKTDLTEADKATLKQLREELPKWEARAKDPAAYSERENARILFSEIPSVLFGFFMLGFVALYFWSSRIPQYIADKRQRATEYAQTGRSALSTILITAIALPFTVNWFETVRYRWSDGHKSEETNINPAVVGLFLLAAFVVMIVVVVMVFLLPFVALFNLVRNRNYIFKPSTRAKVAFIDKIPLLNKLS